MTTQRSPRNEPEDEMSPFKTYIAALVISGWLIITVGIAFEIAMQPEEYGFLTLVVALILGKLLNTNISPPMKRI